MFPCDGISNQSQDSFCHRLQVTSLPSVNVTLLQNCFDGSAKCINITCEFFDIEPDAVIRARFNARLWNTTLADEFGNTVSYVEIKSSGSIFIDPNAQVTQPTNNDRVNVSIYDLDLIPSSV